jgi:hypothetical protein
VLAVIRIFGRVLAENLKDRTLYFPRSGVNLLVVVPDGLRIETPYLSDTGFDQLYGPLCFFRREATDLKGRGSGGRRRLGMS